MFYYYCISCENVAFQGRFVFSGQSEHLNTIANASKNLITIHEVVYIKSSKRAAVLTDYMQKLTQLQSYIYNSCEKLITNLMHNLLFGLKKFCKSFDIFTPIIKPSWTKDASFGLPVN